MCRRMLRACRAAFWFVLLIAASGPVRGDRSPDVDASRLNAAAHSLARMVLTENEPTPRPPLTSDLQHARSIDPVMTRGAVVWIHEALPSPPLTVIGGRVFSYRDIAYDPVDSPVLKIRPIDDDQTIPFLVRAEIESRHGLPVDAALSLTFPAPLIFAPHFDHIRAWVDSKSVRASVRRSLPESLLAARISLAPPDAEVPPFLDDTVTVTVAGELVLEAYRRRRPRRFATTGDFAFDLDLAELAKLEVGRDIAAAAERGQLEKIAEAFTSESPTDYDRVLMVNSWVGRQLQYEEGPATRSVIEALEDRSGDCDEHTAVAVALLRAMGIPARRAAGLLYNFDTLAPHAWVEVTLRNREGDPSWLVVDPTLARTTPSEEEKAAFVQYTGRALLYPFKPTIRLEGTSGRLTSDVLLNWKNPETELLHSGNLSSLVERTIGETDRDISGSAERLAAAGLMLPRGSASLAGSPYLLVDRPLTDNRSTRVRVRLENEERLLLELVAGEETALDSETELEMIDRLRSVYADIDHLLFKGVPARHNLELFYTRDRYTDLLTTVSLRVGRYPMEYFLERILARLSRGGVLTEQETARISAVAKISGGKNLYLLQELARQLPTADPQ